MKKGALYEIEYYGICFSQATTSISILTTLNETNVLTSKKIISDTLNWTKVNFVYAAEGNENYLIIGNFQADSQTDTTTLSNQSGENYYYIDDISVTEINYQFPNVFTPNADGANDVFSLDSNIMGAIGARELTIYNRWGIHIFDSSIKYSWDGRTTSGEPCSDGGLLLHFKNRNRTL